MVSTAVFEYMKITERVQPHAALHIYETSIYKKRALWTFSFSFSGLGFLKL